MNNFEVNYIRTVNFSPDPTELATKVALGLKKRGYKSMDELMNENHVTEIRNNDPRKDFYALIFENMGPSDHPFLTRYEDDIRKQPLYKYVKEILEG